MFSMLINSQGFFFYFLLSFTAFLLTAILETALSHTHCNWKLRNLKTTVLSPSTFLPSIQRCLECKVIFGLEPRAVYLCRIMQQGGKNSADVSESRLQKTGCYTYARHLNTVVGPFFYFVQENLVGCLYFCVTFWGRLLALH